MTDNIEIIDDYDSWQNDMYKEYYENILNQMESQGFSKIQIYAQRIMFENRDKLFEDFCQRYDFEIEEEDDEIKNN